MEQLLISEEKFHLNNNLHFESYSSGNKNMLNHLPKNDWHISVHKHKIVYKRNSTEKNDDFENWFNENE